ncbi:hypothetical protein [Nocardia sp. NPDC127526]|uniref:hypothetical protein n=1 Tax=Nocardia sp. NPDC127526 TaxID=3345393 RepID=UPI0036349B6D
MSTSYNLSMMVIAVGAAVIASQSAAIPSTPAASEATVDAPSSPTAPFGLASLKKSCVLDYTFSKPTVVKPRIDADAWAFCDVPPAEHIVTLKLEKKVDGVWVSMASRDFKQIPPPEPGIKYQTSAECSPGTWRMNVSVVGTLESNPFAWTPGPSREREVSAKECPIG